MKLLLIKLVSNLIKLHLKFKGVRIGKNTVLGGFLFVQNKGGRHSIVLGDHVTIHSMRVFNGVLTNRASLITCPGGHIALGDHCGVSGATIVSTDRITIGEGTLVGADAIIIDNDMHYQSGDGQWQSNLGVMNSGKPISIGKNCFIGMRSIILKGVTIGDSCIVGAGTVLTKDMPDNHIACGNPAIIKPRTS